MQRAIRYGVVHRLVLGLGLVAVLGVAVPAPAAAAATDRLPDLRVVNISDFHITTSGSRRLLRFTGTMWNAGAGPFETRANRANRTSTAWDVDQIVYNSIGGHRRINTPAQMRYAGDGHDHWHVQQMLTYHLWGSRGTLRDAKIGFCFFDTNRINRSLPRSPSRRVYTQSMCGSRTSIFTRNGISVGWGDKYPWNFAYQYINITGLPGGTYTIRSAVDLFGYFSESSETNNCNWARISFGSTGTGIKVVSRGTSCVNDWSASAYVADIAWARQVGISSGCGADMFCTNNVTTRGAMATFVSRAFRYPAATRDYFADDEGNGNEAYINRIAEAGIANGCAPGRFCPNSNATRAQVAELLARAMDLPPASQDYFDDDDGTWAEASTNKLAEAGIFTGCGPRAFCPKGQVTRGQFMGLLHRALVPPTT